MTLHMHGDSVYGHLVPAVIACSNVRASTLVRRQYSILLLKFSFCVHAAAHTVCCIDVVLATSLLSSNKAEGYVRPSVQLAMMERV